MSNTNYYDLRLSENLLIQERDPDQLLLDDPLILKALYIKQGGGYVKQYLAAIKEQGTSEKIAEAFPQDSELLDMLVEHRIVTLDEAPESDKLKPCQHCETGESMQSGTGIALYVDSVRVEEAIVAIREKFLRIFGSATATCLGRYARGRLETGLC